MYQYIDQEKARELLKSNVHRFVVADEKDSEGNVKYFEEVINAKVADDVLATMPTTEEQEKRGKWIIDKDGLPVCSVCGETALQRLRLAIPSMVADIKLVKSPYCPWCGAYLKGDDKRDAF